jgi:hypothetical protein
LDIPYFTQSKTHLIGFTVAIFQPLIFEIIQSEGVVLACHFTNDGISTENYIGRNGAKVQICVSDESMTKATDCFILKQLGLESIMERMF